MSMPCVAPASCLFAVVLADYQYYFLNLITFPNKKTTKAGSTHPKLYACKGIQENVPPMGARGLGLPTDHKKSGTLKTIVTITTALKTDAEAYFSGSTFSRISTMVMG